MQEEFLAQIKTQLKTGMTEFLAQTDLKEHDLFVLGCSTSEIQGKTIGKYSNCILKGDPDRFIEVLQNIMENSVKYGDGRNISIEFSVEEDYQLITVKNSGCTLSDTELPHIFDSFWRGSNVGSNQGSGLGLYICRQLMHKMDGEIFAEIKENNMYVTSVLNKC